MSQLFELQVCVVVTRVNFYAEFGELFTYVIERNNPLLILRIFEVFTRPIYTCLIRLF